MPVGTVKLAPGATFSTTKFGGTETASAFAETSTPKHTARQPGMRIRRALLLVRTIRWWDTNASGSPAANQAISFRRGSGTAAAAPRRKNCRRCRRDDRGRRALRNHGGGDDDRASKDAASRKVSAAATVA